MANIVTIDKLKFFLRKNKNIILRGLHGTGKTTMIRQVFEEEGVKYRIYSAATMDPWVDFIGVPRAVPNGGGIMKRGCDHKIDPKQSLPFCLECGASLFVPVDDEMILQLARPAEWAHNEIEAIFFDEYNRSAKKIRNAVMELIQFKSINGRKFPNLRVVWAAVNPDDDEDLEYDVETIDPAQLDRFHVQLDVPYKPNRKYFTDKFGDEVAGSAVQWWNAIPVDIQKEVSPRRLDYALEIWKEGGHLEDVLPTKANVSALRDALKTTPNMEKLRKLYFDMKDAKEAIVAGTTPKIPLDTIEEEARVFLADDNTYSMVVGEISKKSQLIAVFVPLLPEERISELICQEQTVRLHFLRDINKSDVVRSVMEDIVAAGTNTTAVREITRALNRAKMDSIRNVGTKSALNPNRLASYSSMSENNDFASILNAVEAQKGNMNGTYERTAAYSRIENTVPAKLSITDALNCLKMLNFLVSRSHGKTLRGWVHLVGVVNNCIENLVNGKHDFQGFAQQFPSLVQYVVHEPGFYFSVL